MAVRQITSDPKPSMRHNGWFYAYYSRPTSTGGQCTVIFPPAIADIVRKGFAFEDSCVAYDESLRASVLQLDFDDAPPVDEPSLPPDAEAGWGDVDGLTAAPAAAAVPAAPDASGLATGNGVRPATLRKRFASEIAGQGCQLPPGLMKIGMEVSRLFLMQYSMLTTIPESNRALIAQKLAAIAAIPFYRSAGVNLTEEDVKSISYI
jgi:hypothetical protein